MADTTYIKKVVEPWVRDWLSKRFTGHRFNSRKLPLSNITQDVPRIHEFDAVSEDGTIVTGIKGHSFKTSGGKLPSGKYHSLYQELYFLSLIKATIKFLIITNEDMYRDFKNKSKGKIADGIELMFCQLPESIQQQVRRVTDKASKEMTK